jgi:hypothetical protein
LAIAAAQRLRRSILSRRTAAFARPLFRARSLIILYAAIAKAFVNETEPDRKAMGADYEARYERFFAAAARIEFAKGAAKEPERLKRDVLEIVNARVPPLYRDAWARLNCQKPRSASEAELAIGGEARAFLNCGFVKLAKPEQARLQAQNRFPAHHVF